MTLNEFGVVCVFAFLFFVIGVIVILSPLDWMPSLIATTIAYIAIYFLFRMFVLRTSEQVDVCTAMLVPVSLILGHEWSKYSNEGLASH